MMLRSSSSPVLASIMTEAVRVHNLPRTACNDNAFNPFGPCPRKRTHLTRAISSDYLNSEYFHASMLPQSLTMSHANSPMTKKPEDYPGERDDEEFSFPVPSFSEVDIEEGKEVTVLGLFDLWKGIRESSGSNSSLKRPASSMYIAAGMGMHPIPAIEHHYEKMVKENPCNALVLRNYAKFLHKKKGDYRKAEEFYSRAILADPSDGEILSDYAILRWEEHRDDEMTKAFFERALELSPMNSYILAAYALFTWEGDGSNQV